MIWKYGLQFVSSFVERAGYLLIPKWHLDTWMHAQLLKNLFYTNNIDCVLDIGANRGQFRNFLRHEVGYNGLILSFEPVHHLAELCKKRTNDDTAWHIFEIALGNEESTVPINIAKSGDLSSLLTPLSGDQPFISESAVVHTQLVKMKTLNSIVPKLKAEYDFQNPFLKLDTQGFDLSVIEGAATVLSSIYFIQTELSVVPIYDAMPTWTKVIKYLKEREFEISGLFPVNRDRSSRVVEFDGVFVRAPVQSGRVRERLPE